MSKWVAPPCPAPAAFAGQVLTKYFALLQSCRGGELRILLLRALAQCVGSTIHAYLLATQNFSRSSDHDLMGKNASCLGNRFFRLDCVSRRPRNSQTLTSTNANRSRMKLLNPSASDCQALGVRSATKLALRQWGSILCGAVGLI